MRRNQPRLTRVRYTPTGPQVFDLGYRSVTVHRQSGKSISIGGSGDRHVELHLDQMRRLSQEFDRDNGLYAGVINRALDFILGDGTTLQAKTKNATVNEQLESLWNDYWQRPEIRGMDSGDAVERQVLRSLWVDGDVGTILDDASGLVQVIESERIGAKEAPNADKDSRLNRVVMGVELDKFGKPIRYHVSDYNAQGMPSRKPKPIDADHFIFLANRARSSMTRGVPVQQSSFSMFHRINDVCDSEAIAWQLQSKLALILNRTDAAALAKTGSTAEGSSDTEDIADRYQDFGEGLVFHGEPGEEVRAVERNIPGSNFPESLRMYMRLLGVPLGLPLELVLLDWSNTSYSSARAALKNCERMARRWAWLISGWKSRIYRWKLAQWIADGVVSLRRDIDRHEVHTPPYPFMDPQKEAQAQEKLLTAGLVSPSMLAHEAGLDMEDLVTQQGQDLERIAQEVQRINEAYPFAKLTLADFTAMVKGKAAAAPAPAPAGEDEEDGTPPQQPQRAAAKAGR